MKDERTYAFRQEELQAWLRGLLQQLVACENVDVDMNFFEMGADSQVFMQIAIGVHEKLGVEVEFGQVLENPTVRMLCDQIILLLTEKEVQGSALLRA
jgi:acyl carrier protein